MSSCKKRDLNLASRRPSWRTLSHPLQGRRIEIHLLRTSQNPLFEFYKSFRLDCICLNLPFNSRLDAWCAKDEWAVQGSRFGSRLRRLRHRGEDLDLVTLCSSDNVSESGSLLTIWGNTSFRSCVVRARNLIELSSSVKLHLQGQGRDIVVKPRLHSDWNRCKLKTSLKMMVDFSTSAGPQAIVNVMGKNDARDGGFVTGGGRSEDGKLSYGYSSFQGRRASMEDFYDAKLSSINEQTVGFFGIFDGHGGSRAAEYLKEHLFENLMKHPQFMTDTKLAISDAYQKTDLDFLETGRNTFSDDGSTASTAILIGKHLYVANVGDSRVVMSKAGTAIALSDDHKPNRGDERKRIEDAGGFVIWTGTWRVGGVLAMSRAFGNRLLKQYVVAEPEIQEEDINEQVELLVLASDGLWDVIPNEEAIALARTKREPEAAAQTLIQTAFSRGSADNITCIVVRFHDGNLDANFTTFGKA